MMQSTPPPETIEEKALRELKFTPVIECRMAKKYLDEIREPLLKFNGDVKISGGAHTTDDISTKLRPNVQNNLNLRFGDFVELNNWTDLGLVAGNRINDLYTESQLYLGPNLPIHPVLEADVSTSEKEIIRGGLSTPWVTAPILDRLKIKTEVYPFSSAEDGNGRKERYMWIKAKYVLPKGWTIGGMTKQFSTMEENGGRKHRKAVYNAYLKKELDNKGLYAEVAGWRMTNKEYRLMIGVGRKY